LVFGGRLVSDEPLRVADDLDCSGLVAVLSLEELLFSDDSLLWADGLFCSGFVAVLGLEERLVTDGDPLHAANI